MTFPRLRQLVIASETTDTIDTLKNVFGLDAPFPDPGVAEFGLVNGVFAIGDQFLEVVVPTVETAPRLRRLRRSNDCAAALAEWAAPCIDSLIARHGAWRWGGPDWRQRSAVGRLVGAELTSPDPVRLMARWASALGAAGSGNALKMDDGDIVFSKGEAERLVAFDLSLPDADRVLAQAREAGLEVDGRSVWVAGVEMRLG